MKRFLPLPLLAVLLLGCDDDDDSPLRPIQAVPECCNTITCLDYVKRERERERDFCLDSPLPRHVCFEHGKCYYHCPPERQR